MIKTVKLQHKYFNNGWHLSTYINTVSTCGDANNKHAMLINTYIHTYIHTNAKIKVTLSQYCCRGTLLNYC